MRTVVEIHGLGKKGITKNPNHGVLHHEVFNIGSYEPTPGQNYYRQWVNNNVTGDYLGQDAYREWLDWTYGGLPEGYNW